jgi:hypothetical protein
MTFRLNEDLKITQKTTSSTLALADLNTIVEVSSASNLTLTVPQDSSVDFPDGAQIIVVRYGTGTLQILPDTNVSLRSVDGNDFLSSQYSIATLIKRGANEWYLVGDLSAS